VASLKLKLRLPANKNNQPTVSTKIIFNFFSITVTGLNSVDGSVSVDPFPETPTHGNGYIIGLPTNSGAFDTFICQRVAYFITNFFKTNYSYNLSINGKISIQSIYIFVHIKNIKLNYTITRTEINLSSK
jgi:hypothetical protein